MKIILFILPVVIFLCCSNQISSNKGSSSDSSPITSCKVLFQMPIYADDTLMLIDDYINVYYQDSMRIYECTSFFDSLYQNVQVAHRIDFEYFIHKKGNPKGLRITNFFYKEEITANNTDSMLVERALGNFNIMAGKDLTLISSVAGANPDKLTETYYANLKTGHKFNDTAWFYYDKGLNDIEYSLAKKQDSIVGKKLCKIRVVSNAENFQNSGRWLPRRDFTFEIRRNDSVDVAKIQRLLEKYKANEALLGPAQH
jgi:hypothetical protein